VITAKDVETIYEVPLVFHREGLDDRIVELLNMWTRAPDLSMWEEIVGRLKNPSQEVTIALVGKYVHLRDSYKSLNEALVHGGLANDCKVRIEYVDSEEIERHGVEEVLPPADGILVPGGFGSRGIEGKIEAIRYARERKIPFLGICLGMQLAVVEYARNVAGLQKAHSSEFDPETPDPVIYLMRKWTDYSTGKVEFRDEHCFRGGTMRLGAYPCRLSEGSIAREAYGAEEVAERHRHRYEFNNRYRGVLERAGLRIAGTSPDGELVEIVEVPDHPWFLGCQFHPEFKSRVFEPHPLFVSFIEAALKYRRNGS
ncbi:MAG: CTP synthase, partial [Deltaproteobacteria bacterium]